MPLPTGPIVGILADNLRRRRSVLPIPARAATAWARGLNLPTGGPTVLYTGQMYQLIPYIERLVAWEIRLGDSPLARLAGLGRQINRLVNVTAVLAHPSRAERAEYAQVPVNVVNLLRRSGVEIGYLYADDLYSGALAHDLGADEAVAVQARRVQQAFAKHGVREAITIDPHTTTMLRTVYPKILTGFDVRVRSYLEVLAETAPDNVRQLDVEVTLHDSCVYARFENVIEQPRDLLNRVGVTVLDPEFSRTQTWCCGGPIESLYPEKAAANAAKRVAQLRDTAAECVTMCPLCLVNLRKAAGDTMRLTDISEYLSRAYQ
jgi:Fe-S oxidoreductase